MIKDIIMTGSRVYGLPTEESDWDICIRIDQDDALIAFKRQFQDAEWRAKGYDIDEHSEQFKIGNVNLILCFTDARFESWVKGTASLIKQKPVQRTIAVDLFKALRKLEPKLVQDFPALESDIIF